MVQNNQDIVQDDVFSMLRVIASKGGEIRYWEDHHVLPFSKETIQMGEELGLVRNGEIGPYVDMVIELTPKGRQKVGMPPAATLLTTLRKIAKSIRGSAGLHRPI